MLPERFIDEVERAEKVSRIWRGLTVAAIFSASFFVLAPLLHEHAHILSLESFNCGYIVEWGVSVTGLSASVQPLCTLEGFRQVFFYSSGYLAMIGASGLASAVSIERNNSFLVNEFLSALASGLLFSLILTLELRGDLLNALNVLELSPMYGELFYIFMVLGASSMIYLVVRNFLGQNGSAAARGSS